jgi:hypothetical protein
MLVGLMVIDVGLGKGDHSPIPARPQLHLEGDLNHLMLELAPNIGLLRPPSSRNQRVKTK